MARETIALDAFIVRAHEIWSRQWLALTCGDFDQQDFNTMTGGWGACGTMWSRPFALVVVRPQRHTFTFMERYDSFTLCAFPETCREALQLLGSKSGRDTDKVAQSGLTPIASGKVAAPGYEEAELIVECRKMYDQDLDPRRFMNPAIEELYPNRDYHRMYFGEIVAVSGEPRFSDPA